MNGLHIFLLNYLFIFTLGYEYGYPITIGEFKEKVQNSEEFLPSTVLIKKSVKKCSGLWLHARTSDNVSKLKLFF